MNANPVRFGLGDLFEKHDIDGLWITNLSTIRHLSGFSGSTAHLVASPSVDSDLLVVDSRYTLQAAQECPGHEVITVMKRLLGFFEIIRERGYKKLGIEGNSMTVAEFQLAKEHLPDCELVVVTENLACLRICKTEEELTILRAGIDVADQAMNALLPMIKPGATEKFLAWELEKAMRERGASGVSFPAIVAGGPRSAVVHAQPTDRALERGDLVLIDQGLMYQGYATDRTDTFVLGEPDDKQREIYQVVQDAHDFAIEAVRPGITTGEVDAVARDHIKDKGYGEYFGHSLGHGVGMEVHEMPTVAPEDKGILEPGMIITIEPGIYLEDWGGVRVEDMVLVTDSGCEVLTHARPHGIQSLPLD